MDALRLVPTLQPEPAFHLPDWRSPIIGRDDERQMLADLLRRDGIWLVTITGPGGVGKSRLAHAVARDVTVVFDGNIAWIPLAPALDTERAVETVLHTLGVALPGVEPEQAIALALEGRRALLVLDNLEQIPEFAEFISRLAAGNPGLGILATSRVPLRLGGEQEFSLAPFPTPGESAAHTAEDLRGVTSAELFVARARAADSSFALSDRNAAAIAEICRRLDGLPLAIELAAARVRLLPPQAMVPRLANSLDLLTTGPRDAPIRHQTLRNTIQWSYDLLAPQTQRVFQALGVFSGGFSLEAVQVLIDSDESTLDDVSALLDHSLLIRLDQPDELRFAMLDTIREFAADLLKTSSEFAAVHDLHARFFTGLITSKVERPAQDASWLDLVDREIGNLRDALAWLESRGDTEPLLRLCNLICPWWLSRGSLTEGYEWFRRADRLAGDVPDDVRNQAILNLAWLAAQVGELGPANVIIQRIDPRQLIGEQFKLRITYQMARGALAFFENDLEAAFALIDEARVLAEEAEITPRNPSIRINLGAIAMANHDLEESRKQHVLGIEESSEPGVLSMHYGALAEIEVRSGNLREAWDWLQKTWELCGSLGYVLVMISAMAIKVELLLKLNRPTEAARLMGAADQLRVSRGWAMNVYSEPEYRGLLEACRSALTPSEFDTLMTEGRGMSGAETDAMMREDPFAGTPDTMAEEQTSANRRNLTSREIEVLRVLVEGKTNPEIAAELFISERTVQTHVARILQKLEVPSRSAAAVVAVRDQIIS